MYDHIIVGAGSAGCVLANRLSEDPSVRVLLLEAGGKDRSLKIKIPAAFPEQFHTKLDWDFATEPEPHVDDRALYIPRGKALGGSSSMNAMLYVRGRPLDYDGWEAQGAPGWGYADVLPYFIKAEDNVRGASEYHGAGGPLRVVRAALAATDEPAAAGRQRGGGHPADRRLQRPRAGRRVDVPGHPEGRRPLQRRRRLPAPGAHPAQPGGAHEGHRARRGARRRARRRRASAQGPQRGRGRARRARGAAVGGRDRLAAAAAAVGDRRSRGAAGGRRGGHDTSSPGSGATSRTTRS